MVTVRANYEFSGYDVTPWVTSDVTVTGGTFRMPAKDVTFEAVSVATGGSVNITQISATSGSVTIDLNQGVDAEIVIEDVSGLSGKMLVSKVEQTQNSSSEYGLAYELTVTLDSGTPYSGKMTVTLPFERIGGQEPVVYYSDNGNLEKMNVVGYTDTSVTFETTHNSQYIVSGTSSANDDALVVLGVIVVIAVLFAFAMYFFIRRVEKSQD